MIWTYATAGTVGLTAVALVQMVSCSAVSTLLFGAGQGRSDFWNEFRRSTVQGLTADELTRRAALAGSWQNWVFNGVLTFVAAGFLEETLKYLPRSPQGHGRAKAAAQQSLSRLRSGRRTEFQRGGEHRLPLCGLRARK